MISFCDIVEKILNILIIICIALVLLLLKKKWTVLPSITLVVTALHESKYVSRLVEHKVQLEYKAELGNCDVESHCTGAAVGCLG